MAICYYPVFINRIILHTPESDWKNPNGFSLPLIYLATSLSIMLYHILCNYRLRKDLQRDIHLSSYYVQYLNSLLVYRGFKNLYANWVLCHMSVSDFNLYLSLWTVK